MGRNPSHVSSLLWGEGRVRGIAKFYLYAN